MQPVPARRCSEQTRHWPGSLNPQRNSTTPGLWACFELAVSLPLLSTMETHRRGGPDAPVLLMFAEAYFPRISAYSLCDKSCEFSSSHVVILPILLPDGPASSHDHRREISSGRLLTCYLSRLPPQIYCFIPAPACCLVFGATSGSYSRWCQKHPVLAPFLLHFWLITRRGSKVPERDWIQFSSLSPTPPHPPLFSLLCQLYSFPGRILAVPPMSMAGNVVIARRSGSLVQSHLAHLQTTVEEANEIFICDLTNADHLDIGR